MLIGKNWKVEADSFNIILFKRCIGKNKKTGDKGSGENWAIEGYYGTFKGAIKALADQEVKETELKDLKTVSAKQDELYNLIKSLPEVSIWDLKGGD